MFIAIPHGIVAKLTGFIEMVTPVTCNGAVNVDVGESVEEPVPLADGEFAGVAVEELSPVPPLGVLQVLALSANKHRHSINMVERLNM